MKKYGVTKTVKVCSGCLVFFGIFLFILGIVSAISTGALSHIMDHGFKSIGSDEKTGVFLFIMGIIAMPVTLQQAKVFYGRFICVADEKLYGNIGVGFVGKSVECNYTEIISAQCKNSTVIIESANGKFIFPKIESADECTNEINKKINNIKN